MAEKITYNGKTYTRISGKWVDSNYMVVTHLQKTLDKLFYEQQQPGELSADELIAEGDKFKDAGTIHLAIKNYEAALKTCIYSKRKYVITRLMSCYRERGLPQKAIELYEWARSQNDENLISIPTLISAASAYCDTEQFRLARKCADKAYALNHGKADNILRAVYNRANAGIARQEKLERNR